MVKKISIVWVLATFCVAIVLGAMWVVTASVLDRKQENLRQGAEAYREERIRLAMWRLDTLAAAIVGEEDQRRAEEFELPEAIVPGDETMSMSNELYANAPEHSNLYWEMERDSDEIQTPQVYPEAVLLGNGVDVSFNRDNSAHYEEVKAILSNKLDEAIRGEVPQCDTNKDLSCVVAQLSIPQQEVPQEVAQKEDFSLQSVKGEEPEVNAVQMKNQRAVQQKLSKVDTGKRRQAVNRISGNYQWSAQEAKGKPLLPAQKDKEEITPFQPVWLDGELMLVRKVVRSSGESVQGVWLNAAKVKRQLLAEVEDLFPNADLVPVSQDLKAFLEGREIGGDTQTMLKLPFKLVPGVEDEVTLGLGDLMKGPIGLAWLGALLAVAASFFMLRSVMKMSERRASFVSAVTHELRTPLTTFRLYTDMLSSGMVRDEEKKGVYLETLRRESERLTHLVENVLAYSRIERGSARARIEETTVASLMERMLPRLRDRAAEEAMTVSLDIEPEIRQQKVKLDITAVEQIIFNLVDNAAKYASGEGCGDEIRVEASQAAGVFQVTVSDQGKGIPSKDRKRLFNAFHKSAEEAAVTKPGVGLGLALCRRLARAMGGDLVLEKTAGRSGSTFLLTLPQKN